MKSVVLSLELIKPYKILHDYENINCDLSKSGGQSVFIGYMRSSSNGNNDILSMKLDYYPEKNCQPVAAGLLRNRMRRNDPSALSCYQNPLCGEHPHLSIPRSISSAHVVRIPKTGIFFFWIPEWKCSGSYWDFG